NLSVQNKWILSRLQRVTVEVENSLAHFELNVGAQSLYGFVWQELCDWFIEFSKLPMRKEGKERTESLYVLHWVLEKTLHLLHPFVPFVTEELWQSLPWVESKTEVKTLMLQRFPISNSKWVQPEVEDSMQKLQSFIESVRNFRGENNISPK